MAINIAINGYGRIGSNVLRAIYESNRQNEIRIVAINSIANAEVCAYLTQHDSIHGRFPGEVILKDHELIVNGDSIQLLQNRNPEELPWTEMGVDVVHECTGAFTHRDQAEKHVQAGAKKVIISAPGQEVDATIVYGVNHHTLTNQHSIISNASCTTNCLAPLVQPLHQHIGVVSGVMNTIHAFTNDQHLNDGMHSDLRRARSATRSVIPTKTGAAAAVGLVLPELAGKLDGFALRVPTNNVSIVDLTFQAQRETSVEEINSILHDAANGALKNVLGYSDESLVSIDFNHNPLSSIYDPSMTRIQNKTLVKVCAWYDNEWGFSNRMLDTTVALMNAA